MHQSSRQIPWKAPGFTVIELLVVVALIGILASIAIPSYQDKVMRANRTDALAPIQRVLTAEENYYINNRSYAVDLTQLGFESSPLTTEYYIISARPCTGDGNDESTLTDCIEVFAEAQGSQIKDGNIIINTQGRSQREITENNIKSYIDF